MKYIFCSELDFVSRATVVADSRLSAVRPTTQVSQKPLHGSMPDFVKSYLSAISPELFFSFFKIFDFQIFTIFCFLFINMGPYGSQNFKTLLLPQLRSSLKILWHFEIFLSTGPLWGWKFQNATPTVFI